MPALFVRRTGKLTAAGVYALQMPGDYGDGNGLWLRIRPPAARNAAAFWVPPGVAVVAGRPDAASADR